MNKTVFLYPVDPDEYPDPRDYYDPKESMDETDVKHYILDYPEEGDDLDFE